MLMAEQCSLLCIQAACQIKHPSIDLDQVRLKYW